MNYENDIKFFKIRFKIRNNGKIIYDILQKKKTFVVARK